MRFVRFTDSFVSGTTMSALKLPERIVNRSFAFNHLAVSRRGRVQPRLENGKTIWTRSQLLGQDLRPIFRTASHSGRVRGLPPISYWVYGGYIRITGRSSAPAMGRSWNESTSSLRNIPSSERAMGDGRWAMGSPAREAAAAIFFQNHLPA